MFRKLLQKLVDEYAGQPSYMGGDLEEDLDNTVCGSFEGGMRVVPRKREGYIRALYDLGVLVALEPPGDGEVTVNVRLASAILALVKTERVNRHLACHRCWEDVGPDAVRLIEPRWRMNGGAPYRDVYTFCPKCAAAAGPEWVKP